MLGEVDVFQVQPDYELYDHSNINYLQLDRVPSFADGWQSILDALRSGRFFVTTGEILIPSFTLNGKRSGETLKLPADGTALLEADLCKTVPLAFAEVITGDGQSVSRKTNPAGEHRPVRQSPAPNPAATRWLQVGALGSEETSLPTEPSRSRF